MKDEKNIFNFESDSDDNQEKENEEENNSNKKNNSPSPSNDENDKEPENVKLKRLVNTLLNSKTKKKYDSIYEVDMAYFIKNEDISSNFEKRAKNEETLYGWYIPDESDECLRIGEMIMRLKAKGLEKIEQEIMVSPPEDYNIDYLYSVIICRFILGKNVGLNREKELSEKDKEQYLKKNYDTVYWVNPNDCSLKCPKRYNILKKENIELLYFVRLKKNLFE